MRMQQNLVSGDRQIVFSVAAPQHGFPNPDIQIDQTRANPIRSFAATVLSVPHAGRSRYCQFTSGVQIHLRLSKSR